jgi:NADH-quinone oxidoreductase subunit J
MTTLFYIAGAVAIVATIMVVTRSQLVHALLYLVVSLFAVALVFFTLGAPFVAALEVIVYAGAIMMLFVFAVMLLDVRAQKPPKIPWAAWVGPVILIAVLLAELVYGIRLQDHALAGASVGPKQVSTALFGSYVLGVELASMLLLAALIGARHIAAEPTDAPAGEADEGATGLEEAPEVPPAPEGVQG